MGIKIFDSSLQTVFMQFLTLDRELVPFISDTYYEYVKYIPLFIIMFVLAFLLTPLIGQLANHFGITDDPSGVRKVKWNKHDNPERHIHKNPTPYFGGLAVLIPLLIIIPIIFKMQGDLVFLYAGIIILTISGYIDDKYNMPAKYQLIIQLAAATLLALTTKDLGILKIPFDGTIDLAWLTHSFDIFGIPASLSLPGDIILILWTVFFINAVKWVAGLDALLEGNMIIAYTLMFVLGVRTGDLISTVMSIMLVGGIFGFTIYNFPPAKIFSGSAGKTTYGYIAAALALFGGSKTLTSFTILLLPIMDAIYVIIKRQIKHKPKNPLQVLRMNDTTHLHHELLKLDLDAKQILFIEGGITLIIGSLAVLTAEAYNLFIIMFGVTLITILFTVVSFLTKKGIKKKGKQKKEESPESKYSY